MFIPTWILIIVIAGVAFYYFNKSRKVALPQQKVASKSGVLETKENWLNDENWKEKMLEHLSKYPERTGRETPTYDEMLNLDKDEFKAWIFVRSAPDFQDELIKEMLDHEEKTGSFTKTGRNDDGPFTKLILDVFNRARSKKVVDVLRRMSETANKLIDEGADGEKADSIQNAILAKATSDYYKLGEKMEKENNN